MRDENVERTIVFLTRKFRLLILPSSGPLPLGCLETIEKFIAGGGDVLALGAPAFTDFLWKYDNTWTGKRGWRERLETVPAENLIFDFEDEDISKWTRSTNSPSSPSHYKTGAGFRGKSLHAVVEKLEGWDTVSPPDPVKPFPNGHTLTAFYAKA